MINSAWMLEQFVFSGLHFLAGAECLSPDISRVQISAVINIAWMLEQLLISCSVRIQIMQADKGKRWEVETFIPTSGDSVHYSSSSSFSSSSYHRSSSRPNAGHDHRSSSRHGELPDTIMHLIHDDSTEREKLLRLLQAGESVDAQPGGNSNRSSSSSSSSQNSKSFNQRAVNAQPGGNSYRSSSSSSSLHNSNSFNQPQSLNHSVWDNARHEQPRNQSRAPMNQHMFPAFVPPIPRHHSIIKSGNANYIGKTLQLSLSVGLQFFLSCISHSLCAAVDSVGQLAEILSRFRHLDPPAYKTEELRSPFTGQFLTVILTIVACTVVLILLTHCLFVCLSATCHVFQRDFKSMCKQLFIEHICLTIFFLKFLQMEAKKPSNKPVCCLLIIGSFTRLKTLQHMALCCGSIVKCIWASSSFRQRSLRDPIAHIIILLLAAATSIPSAVNTLALLSATRSTVSAVCLLNASACLWISRKTQTRMTVNLPLALLSAAVPVVCLLAASACMSI